MHLMWVVEDWWVTELSSKSVLQIILALLILASILIAANTRPVKSYTQPPGLVGYWNLDQGSGTVAYDSSGYNNNGTIYGASWTNGKVGLALLFDGIDDYVDCGNNETLDPTQGATIEAWVSFSQLPSAAGHYMTIAGRSGMATDLDLQAELDNRFKFYIGPGYVVVSSTVAEANEWYHVVGTYEANNNMKIYVNGMLEQTTLIGISRNTNPNNFSIGQSLVWPGRFFNGTIDEVKIYDRALSANDVKAEYIQVSISPLSNTMDAGQSQQFTSSVSGGTPPCTYQSYSNETVIDGATSSIYTFTPSSRGYYNICVNITDNIGIAAASDAATLTVNDEPSVTISPASVTIDVNQSQIFNSSIIGGTLSYAYQWYLDGVPVSSATSDNWTFTPTSIGSYTVYLNVTDGAGAIAISSVSEVTVNPAIPEFTLALFLPIFMIATLLSVVILRRTTKTEDTEAALKPLRRTVESKSHYIRSTSINSTPKQPSEIPEHTCPS
jgi:hypothetical protein